MSILTGVPLRTKPNTRIVYGEFSEVISEDEKDKILFHVRACLWRQRELDFIKECMLHLTEGDTTTSSNPEYTRALAELWDMICLDDGEVDNPFIDYK
jgi:hypothetical protein